MSEFRRFRGTDRYLTSESLESAVLSEPPHSAHVAVGSPVTVRFGRRIA